MAEESVHVQVIYAGPGQEPVVRSVAMPAGGTVRQALEASNIAMLLPAGLIDPGRVGIYSRKVSMEQTVREGDRIEIYRPLLLDPMAARRRRAR